MLGGFTRASSLAVRAGPWRRFPRYCCEQPMERRHGQLFAKEMLTIFTHCYPANNLFTCLVQRNLVPSEIFKSFTTLFFSYFNFLKLVCFSYIIHGQLFYLFFFFNLFIEMCSSGCINIKHVRVSIYFIQMTTSQNG